MSQAATATASGLEGRPRRPVAGGVAAVVALAAASAALVWAFTGLSGHGAGAGVAVAERFMALPLAFEPNRGQARDEVRYSARGSGYAVALTERGASLSLRSAGGRAAGASAGVGLALSGADPSAITAERKLPGTVSYFKGDRESWQAGLPTYEAVRYTSAWPGIDVLFYGNQRHLEYDFVVAAGSDPDRIGLRVDGAEDLSIAPSGDLLIGLGRDRTLRQKAPVAYQRVNGERTPVEAAYALAGGRVGFELGSYDASRPLVIDPIVLGYAGYIGGLTGDPGTAIAVDGQGSAYIAGLTASSEVTFPVQTGPDTTFNDDDPSGCPGDCPEPDAFVAKVAPDGSSLVYAGYIGGEDSDQALGVAVDAQGAAYVTGDTASDEATFPIVGGLDATQNGGSDAFVAKVAPDGSSLSYSGFLGGDEDDRVSGVSVDSQGAAYVAGHTSSTETTFPVAVGPDLTHNGGTDAFVAKVEPSGEALAYAGYIGGSSSDQAEDIAFDAQGNAYVTGFTSSGEPSFPVAVGPDLTHNGGSDAFVAKVEPSGEALAYAGYIGGNLADGGFGIAVDEQGSAYVAGSSNASNGSFPVAVGPDLTHNGGDDAFVAKVEPSGEALAYAGYVGGNQADGAQDIALDSQGNAYITGITSSQETTFPATAGPDLTYNGGTRDAFVAKVAAGGASLAWAGYIGGAGDNDQGRGVAVDAQGDVYVGGYTDSASDTFPATVGPDLTKGGFDDAFVAKIIETDLAPGPGPTPGPTLGPTHSLGPVAEPSNAYSVKGTKASSKRGVVTLSVEVPGPGKITGKATAKVPAALLAARRKGPKRSITVAGKTLRPKAAGVVKLKLKARKRAKRLLRRKGKLRASVRITYTPTGGTPRTQKRKVTFKLGKRQGRKGR